MYSSPLTVPRNTKVHTFIAYAGTGIVEPLAGASACRGGMGPTFYCQDTGRRTTRRANSFRDHDDIEGRASEVWASAGLAYGVLRMKRSGPAEMAMFRNCTFRRRWLEDLTNVRARKSRRTADRILHGECPHVFALTLLHARVANPHTQRPDAVFRRLGEPAAAHFSGHGSDSSCHNPTTNRRPLRAQKDSGLFHDRSRPLTGCAGTHVGLSHRRRRRIRPRNKALAGELQLHGQQPLQRSPVCGRHKKQGTRGGRPRTVTG